MSNHKAKAKEGKHTMAKKSLESTAVGTSLDEIDVDPDAILADGEVELSDNLDDWINEMCAGPSEAELWDGYGF